MASQQIQQLEAQLRQLVSGGGPLKIQAGTITNASAVDALFTQFLCNAQLTINGVFIGIPAGTDFVQIFGTGSSTASPPNPYNLLTLDGRFHWSDKLKSYTLTLTGTTTSQTWSLATAFPFFQGPDPFDAPFAFTQIVNPAFTLESANDEEADPSFTFQGDVPFRGQVMFPLNQLFNGIAQITVKGAITSVGATTGVPLFAFSGESTPVTIGTLFEVTPALKLSYGPPPAGGAPAQAVYAEWELAYLTPGGSTESLTVYTQSPFSDPTMTFEASAGQTNSFLFGALQDLTRNNFGALMPTQLSMPSGFGLKIYALTVNPSDLSLVSLSVTAGTTRAWPIIGDITLDALNFEFTVDPRNGLSITITANFLVDAPTKTNLTLMGSYPSFAFGGSLVSGGSTELTLKALVTKYSSDAAELLPPLPLTELSIFVDPTSAIYRFHTSLGSGAQPWNITLLGVTFGLTDVAIDFGSIAGNVTAGGSASINLPTTTTPIIITVGVQYATAGGWTFKGSVQNVSFGQLIDLIGQYFPTLADVIVEVESALGFNKDTVTINQLAIELTPKTKEYHFTADLTWQLEVFDGNDLVVNGTFDFVRTDDADVATLNATAQYESVQLGVTLVMNSKENPKYVLTFQWSDFVATWQKPVATFNFGTRSIGDLVGFFTSQVAGSSYTLISPWDVLNSISLTGLEVKLDFSKKTASFTVPLTAANFGFIDLQSVEMTVAWDKKAGNKVNFSIPNGTFLGQPFTSPKQWNILDPQSTPAVPGFGQSLVQVDFLGLSQRYTPRQAIPTVSVEAALKALRTAFENPADPTKGMLYSSTANWSIGFEAWFCQNTIWVGALFLDEPELYGVAIQVVPGGRFATFAGLHFEILYKKLSNDLGVYQAELTLPDSLRNFNLGAVAVTLPYFALWIYTNGDFKANFGFPQNGDFSQSFSLTLLPFTGAGGFYFGVLPPCAVASVPQTKSDGSPLEGSFNPVIVFGLGLAVGLEEGVFYGIASGGLSLLVQGIIEGVFATYTPYKRTPDGGDQFWAVTGKLALVGRLFGEVNFAIIVARFDVTITLSVTFVMGSYQPSLFTFTASVEVSASISIDLGLFSITIGFSFTIEVSDSFTIGSGSTPPWDLPSSKRRFRLATSLTGPAVPGATLTWQPVTASETIDICLVPHVTSASAVTSGTKETAKAQIVAMTYIERALEPSAKASPFATFAQGVLLWVINAGVNGKPVTQAEALALHVTFDQARAIYQTLADAGPNTPFTDIDLTTFLDHYIVITVRQRTASDPPITAGVFPIAPVMSLQVMQQTPIDFGDYNKTTAATLDAIRRILLGLQPSATAIRRVDLAAAGGEQSLATFLFRDYVSMICKGVVQAVVDYLKQPQTDATGQSLAGIAARFGTTAAELAALNRRRKLRPGVALKIGAGAHTVGGRSSETFLGIARRHRTTVGELAEANATTADLFDMGVTLTLPPDSLIDMHSIITNLQKSLAFDNLAGQAARVALQGLRPPWPQPSDTTQALYSITGQEFDASAMVAGDSYTLSVTAAAKWITIPDGKVIIDSGTAAQIAQYNGARIAPAFSSAIQPFYNVVAKRFTLAAPVQWSVTGNVSLGAGASGSATDGQSIGIWQLPSNLVRILADTVFLEPPLVALDEETADAADLPPSSVGDSVDPTSYAWATAFSVELARIPSSANPGQSLANTYNLFGTDVASSALLEALLRANSAGAVPIQQIYILFPLTPGSALPADGVTSNPIAGTSFFVMQTNLSTDANPPGGSRAIDDADSGAAAPTVDPVGMTSIEMLQLIWECSAVRSVGYQLFYEYRDGKSSTGLPDFLFQQNGRGEVTILVTYAYTDDRLRPFMNGVVVSQPVDTQSILYVEAIDDTKSKSFSGQTLQQIATSAQMTLFELATWNREARISAGTELALPRNRGMLALDEPESLESLAARNGVTLAALAHANRDRVIAFDEALIINPLLLDRGPAMRAGEIGFYATRTFTPGGDLGQQYQLLDYHVAANHAFKASSSGLPLGPVKPPDVQPPLAGSYFAAVVPITGLAIDPGVPGGPPPANDPYRGIGQTVEIDLDWHDIFGNVITIEPSTPNPYVLTHDILYFDNLVPVSAWPATGLQYRIAQNPAAGSTPALFVDVTFDDSRYDPVKAGMNWLGNATGDQGKLAAIYYQIARNVTITMSSTLDASSSIDVTKALIGFVTNAYSYVTHIVAGQHYAPPVSPLGITLTAPVADTSGQALFALSVELEIARTPDLVEPSVDDPLINAAASVSSAITPAFQHPAGETGSPTSLLIFAQDIQKCFPTLMTATGTPDAIDAQPQVWLVRFGAKGFKCAFSDPYYFALPPLSLQPLSLSDVQIATYDGTKPLQNMPPSPRSFTNVDIDQIARDFLTAMDLCLSPDYVVPAWRIISGNPSLPSNPVTDTLTAKFNLAGVISAHLIPPYASQAALPSPNYRDAAVAKLQQELLVQLSPAYQIDSVVTLLATVNSPFGDLASAPRLFGQPIGPAGAVDTQYAISNSAVPLCGKAMASFLTFTFTTPDKTASSVVDLKPSYNISHLQYGLQPMPPPLETYTASSWLSFVIPFSQASPEVRDAVPGTIGKLEIPIPLKAFPSAPTISTQSAAGFPEPETVAQARLWSYAFAYDYAGASQDDVHARVNFTNPDQLNATTESTQSFEEQLLQFSTAWPAILADLNANVARPGGEIPAINALLSFAWLATNIAAAWPVAPPVTESALFNDEQELDFTIDQQPITVGQNTDVFAVVVGKPGDGFAIPTIDIPAFTRVLLPGKDDTYIYTWGDATPPQYLPYEQGLTLTSRAVTMMPAGASDAQYFDVLTRQQAWGSAATGRNEFYGEELCPGNPLFIYRSPYARASTPAVPLLTTTGIDMGKSTTGNAPLATFLQNFVNALLTPVGGATPTAATLQISAAFQYYLGSTGSLPVQVPLFLTVPGIVTAPFLIALADAITAELPAEAKKQLMANSQLNFVVSLFSSDSTAATLPVLRLTDVFLNLARIDFGG